jgi:hypothetical protein
VVPLQLSAEANPTLADKARVVEVLERIGIVRLTEVLFPNNEQAIDHDAMWLLVSKWLNECGDPTDAVERKLCEMMLITWHAATSLLSRLAAISEVAHIPILSAAAGRQQAEYRKSVQTLADYRAKRIILGTVPHRRRSDDLDPGEPSDRNCTQDAQPDDDRAAS